LENIRGEKIIYFSETVHQTEQDELTDIFYQTNSKYSKNYADVFHDLGWMQFSREEYIFGEIEIKEIRKQPSYHK